MILSANSLAGLQELSLMISGDLLTHKAKFKDIDLCPVILNDKIGYIDRDGETIIEPKYDVYDGWIWSSDGRIEIPNLFDLHWEFLQPRGQEGIIIVYKNGKFGYCSENGNEVMPCVFGEVSVFQGGYARVELNGKWAVINNSFEFIT